MANGYDYVTPASVGVSMFPGETFDPTMVFAGTLNGARPVLGTPDAPVPTLAAATGFDFGSVNWAVVLIVAGVFFLAFGRKD